MSTSPTPDGVRKPTLSVFGGMTLSVILYCINGRSSPAFQKL